LAKALLKWDLAALDCALDLLAPPVAQMCALITLWAALIVLLWCIGSPSVWMVGIWFVSLILLMCYIIGGFVLSGAPKSAYSALAFGPFYMVWKLFALAAHSTGWVRTTRQAVRAEAAQPNDKPANSYKSH
jgi:hypothetical protein